MRVDVTEPRIRAVREAVMVFGGQQRTAEALGVTQQTVNDWVCGRKPVPGHRALVIEKLTRAAGRPVVVERLLEWEWDVVRGVAA